MELYIGANEVTPIDGRITEIEDLNSDYKLPKFVTDVSGEELYHVAQQQSELTGPALFTDRLEDEVVFATDGIAWLVQSRELPADEIVSNIVGAFYVGAESAMAAPLYGHDDVTALIVSDLYTDGKMFLSFYDEVAIPTNMILVSGEDGYEYVDDGEGQAMIFDADEYQYFDSFVVTKRFAKKNPEEYIEIIKDSSFIEAIKWIDPEEYGFQFLGEFSNGMYKGSRKDVPETILKDLESEGVEVLFENRSYGNPFETTFHVYGRRTS